ncbi:hypothetical protein ACE6H2_027078 [Prunus campanulata]
MIFSPSCEMEFWMHGWHVAADVWRAERSIRFRKVEKSRTITSIRMCTLQGISFRGRRPNVNLY